MARLATTITLDRCPCCGQPFPAATLHFEYESGWLRYQGRAVHLSRTEADIMACLTQQPGRFHTIGAIFDCIYGSRPDAPESQQIVIVFMCKLRRRIRPLGLRILTERARGYLLAPIPSQPEH